jgi:hypothetical protein
MVIGPTGVNQAISERTFVQVKFLPMPSMAILLLHPCLLKLRY